MRTITYDRPCYETLEDLLDDGVIEKLERYTLNGTWDDASGYRVIFYDGTVAKVCNMDDLLRLGNALGRYWKRLDVTETEN